MSDFQQILYDAPGAVATITFNRPEKLNAWTPVMEAEVARAIAAAGAAPAVKAVVFTGAGRGFCAGADLGAMEPNRPRPGPERFAFLWNAPKPLFAAINGPMAGVGLSIALHCDFRYIAESASVTTAFARRGLIAEHGMAWLLPRLIGLQNASDLLLSGRKVEAREAAEIGLARLLPDEGFLLRVQAIAGDLLAQSSPRSVKVMRQQLRAGLEQNFYDALDLAHREQMTSLQSADFREGVAAFQERRPANFPGD